jgi:peroxiredoxin
MKKMTRFNFTAVSILVLLISGAWIYISAPDQNQMQVSQEAPSVGFIAPDFELETMQGESIHLADLRGKAVIINLWASWCGPCRAEMPAMQTVFEKYADEDFTILAVNATNQDDISSARAFASELGLSYPILLDVNGIVSDLYNLRALPTTFFIDPEGQIQEVIIGGPMAEALLEIRAQNLIGMLP